MAVRLIAVDMDGTLLKTDQTITDRTQKAIKKAQEQGIEFVLGTGRSDSECAKYYPQLDINYSIYANGAYVMDPSTKKEYFKKCLSVEDARKIFEIYNDYYAVIFIQADHWVHAMDDFETRCKKFPEYIYDGAPVELPYVMEKDLGDFLKNRTEDIEKFHVSFLSHEEANEAYERLSKLDVKVVWCGPYVVEVTHKEVDKGVALKMLADRLGIDRNEVMAIGDSENDKSMLDYAGISVAMGNAQDSIKNSVTYVVPSNNEDGVAYAIEHYALCEN